MKLADIAGLRWLMASTERWELLFWEGGRERIMREDGRFIMAEIGLIEAFEGAGCPICQVMDATAGRYISNLLHENVNEFSSRIHIIRSLGFCPEHTWRLFYNELPVYGDYGGISIIYGDLVRRVANGVRELRAGLQDDGGPPHRRRLWLRLRLALGLIPRKPAQPHIEGLHPTGPCRVCTFVREAETSHLLWLVNGLVDDEFRARYVASDGLCRKHLVPILEMSAADWPDIARFIADDAVDRLSGLAGHLEEYTRKRAWQYRDERVTPAEEEAPRKATQFFGGPEPVLVGDARRLAEAEPERDRIKQLQLGG